MEAREKGQASIKWQGEIVFHYQQKKLIGKQLKMIVDIWFW